MVYNSTGGVMSVIYLETATKAPPEACFDLALDVDFHQESTWQTGEQVVGGVTSGLLGLGDVVTWEARHFGRRWRLTAEITQCVRPHFFADEQQRGPFRWMRHAHFFVPREGGTLMVDVFRYAAPLGPLGRLAEALALDRHLRGFLYRRNACLKQAAESDRAEPRTAWR